MTPSAQAVAESSPLRATLNPAAVAEGGAAPVSVIGEAQGWLERAGAQVGILRDSDDPGGEM
eukprot:651913-Pyramimonas_sp.AAC.1